ncbi:heterokaryon incompatibility protein-domain-containing protein, partial [Lasiosphaeris hirsuta]
MVADSLVLGILRATGKRPKAQPDDFIGLIDHTRPPSQLFIGAQKIEPRQIDYERLKTWIDFCQDKHKGLCLSPNAKPPPKFRVIDITTRRVVQAPKECNYVALSYVWGNPADSTNSGFSCVVEDSMIVCKALGYRYLWVDQDCNDQGNPNVLEKQVNAMDAVYGNAHLTIIAAAGEDSAYGLPGVGLRPRVTQQLISLGKTTFIRTFTHLQETLKASKWATRGWTFQEGVLSTRKLIFTDHQVAFQCNGMHCSE